MVSVLSGAAALELRGKDAARTMPDECGGRKSAKSAQPAPRRGATGDVAERRERKQERLFGHRGAV
jgi:hypothetical protein